MVDEHADHEHERPRHPLLEVGERAGDGAAAVGIVAAVEPQLAARRDKRREPALRQPLHARRPIRLGDAGLESGGRKLEPVDGAQRGDGDAGILELVAPEQLRRRQIEQAVVVLIDEAAALLGCHPILAGDADRRLDPRRLPLDGGQRLARLRRHDRRHLRLEDAGLLGRDLADGIAEMLGMIERDRRDHGGERAVDDIGGVEPSAQPDFEQQHVGRMAREQASAPPQS